MDLKILEENGDIVERPSLGILVLSLEYVPKRRGVFLI